MARQPRADLHVLYQGWVDTLLALLATRLTGRFAIAESPEHAAARQGALAECARLEAQMSGLRTAAAKEKQIARQVELNLEVGRLQAEYADARAKL